MKKAVLVILACNLITNSISGQEGVGGTEIQVGGMTQGVSFGISIPVGEFSETHYAGIHLGYSWTHHRHATLGKLPESLIGFIAQGGLDYYFGKKEMVVGYDFRYGGFMYLHIAGGGIYNPGKKVNISLSAGPSLGLYKSAVDPGIRMHLSGSYYFKQRFAITPAVVVMKHDKTRALWTTSASLSFAF